MKFKITYILKIAEITDKVFACNKITIKLLADSTKIRLWNTKKYKSRFNTVKVSELTKFIIFY